MERQPVSHLRRVAMCILGLASCAVTAHAADVEIRVAADQPGHAVSPRLVGVFFEDINFGGDGGLNAELVKNGAFEFPRALMGWREVRDEGRGRLTVASEAPYHAANANFMHIENGAGGLYGAANEGFRGIGVKQGEPYRFTAQARSVAGRTAAVLVRIASADGEILAEAAFAVEGSAWREIAAELTPAATDAAAKLEILLAEPGQVDLDLVSLCPVHTWQDRPHGLRVDLVQKLADLKPAFFRFPGGCIVEGSQLKYRYQWKTTIGDRADRRLIVNRWNTEFAHRLTPDYFQSFGVGFFEYFQLSEDLGAEPLPILNCGMACQFNSKELVALDELQPYIQDALDLIEFANGTVDSPWGARRAAMGHPAPFGMKLLGVGNEQWGEQYLDRYERFAEAIKAKYPEIELVSGAGPFPVGPDFDFAWSRLRPLHADIVDEHCYACPEWFQREATRFDAYPRGGPAVFMGEYAAQSVDICSPDNRNSLRCALGEAAFLTGIERNSDVVTMSSYAPLFGHEDAWQWRPNLIWFDNLQSYATPNYYVQQLFSRHRGDVVLPVEIDDPRPRRPAGGRIGVGVSDATAEFKDLQVTQGDETVWTGDELAGAEALDSFRGRWEFESGEIVQTAPGVTARALFGNYDWRDATLSMKVRKTAGPGGLAIIFRGSPGGSFLQWNLGAAGNRRHALQAFLARHSTENPEVAATDGSLEEGRWYEVRIELNGPRVRCYLDGELIHDAEIAPLQLPWLYAVAGLDEQHEAILKVVHGGDQPVAAAIDLGDVTVANADATVVQLAGNPEAINTIAEPANVAPQTSVLKVPAPKFTYEFAPHSLTILRVPLQ
ncbi:MAG: carbohydrate binding domain-containing protein [Planctomycetales bacterium]|nr:carbohydrate binding domain-containing protein [Planctomycetales bacterium]